MYKNFSATLLGISGRQSELIELALTYGFRGIDVDMTDMVKRTQRTDFEDASKYLRAAEILIGGFRVDVDLDADDETFAKQLAAVHPVAEIAAQLEAQRAFIMLPAASDRMPITEYFDVLRDRLNQIGEVLGKHGVKLGVNFNAGHEAIADKQFELVNKVEGFVALVNAVPADNVGFVIDSWHWNIGGGTAEQLQQIPAAKVIIVRLADLADGVDPSEAKIADRVLPVLEGKIDQVAIIKWLAEAGYDGPVLASSSAAKAKGQTRESIVNRAQENIDEIFVAAGLTVEPRPMDLIQSMYSDDDGDLKSDDKTTKSASSSDESDSSDSDSDDAEASSEDSDATAEATS